MSERELQDAILELAKIRKWLAYHVYDSRRSVPGFPDLVLLRGKRMVVAELKSATGRLTKEQIEWIHAFTETGAETHIWRPEQWRNGTIDNVLK